MAKISICDLPTGSQLFSDSETYLQELTESDLKIQGGYYLETTWTMTSGMTITIIFG